MADPEIDAACIEIDKICRQPGSKSKLYTIGDEGYDESLRHWVESSNQESAAAVQPGSVDDLCKIVKVLAQREVPFAVKGGGHAMCPGHSSTQGIHISMALFKKVEYHSESETLEVGAGCIWEDVYLVVDAIGRNIVGGSRSDRVGVAGYLLGGGYSLKTNQYGLGVDNIVAIEVVLPDGSSVTTSGEDNLFKALKGGGNNFGIVTQFTLKTHIQGPVYTPERGSLVFKDHEEEVRNAIGDFIRNEKRSKAVIVAAFRYKLGDDKPETEVDSSTSVLCFFDGEKPSDDPFQRFCSIPHEKNIASHEMTYAEFRKIASDAYDSDIRLPPRAPSKTLPIIPSDTNARGRFGCIMVTGYTQVLIDFIAFQAKTFSGLMKGNKGRLVLIDVWPFLPSIFDNSSAAAWPHTAGKAVSPLLAYFLWEDESKDNFWLGQMDRALESIRGVAYREGCTLMDAPVYLNTSLEDTPVEWIYRENLTLLKSWRRRYDPKNVMGRAGGFKIPL